ncbi:MAG: aminotransferase class I/II-fold pyridoxal phosphate-dependent enzyme [Oscillospiraceae bacterium]|jgi:threonine-phosphate decarboxylase|nr:aminotransferase class I/II-fold pyridoxal phosphate-dependent enzyme [Oscillospiraceae bacterium]
MIRILPHRKLIHGGDIESAAERNPDSRAFLDFSVNVNPFGIPLSVREALEASVSQAGRYPDPACRRLRGELAVFEGVGEEQLLCGGGAGDLIYRVAYALRPRQSLVLAPTFEEYELALIAAGSGIRRHLLAESGGFAPTRELLADIRGCDLVVICNPNNPTGVLADPKLMADILFACMKEDAALLVDECFLDFIPAARDYTLKTRLRDYKKLIILRAFTKIFAIPGVRLGHLICPDPGLLRRIDEAGPPWGVSAAAQAAGIAACREGDFLKETARRLTLMRHFMEGELHGCGLRVYRGCANFILFYSHDESLGDKLAAGGILVRDCRGFESLGPGWFRAAVRNGEDVSRLARAISGGNLE